MDNTKRPKVQRLAFTQACIDAVKLLAKENASLLVVGNTSTDMFPKALIPFTIRRQVFGEGKTKVNFLVNYGWQWDLKDSFSKENKDDNIMDSINLEIFLEWI